MPSGSKKRKASRKPKPGEPPSSQGEPSELETGLEESMGKDGEEMMEGSPSPKAMDGSSEAVAEVGVAEVKELLGEALQEVAEVEEASAPVELVYEASRIAEAEAPDGSEVEREAPVDAAVQGEPFPQIKEEISILLDETEPESDAPPAEIKPEVEADARPTGLEHDVDDVSAPPIGIALVDADETMPRDIGGEPLEAQIGSEAGPDESPLEVEYMGEVAQEDMVPENGTVPSDVTAMGIEPGEDEYPVEIDAQPEIVEAMIAREQDADATSANIEPEGTYDTPNETAAETDEGPFNGQSEMNEPVVEMPLDAGAVVGNPEMDLVNGAAVLDPQPEMDEDPAIREVDADIPSAIIEPAATDDTLSETIAETDKGPPDVQSGMGEATERIQPETDAVPSKLESDTAAESEFEREATQVGEGASAGEIEREVEPAGPRLVSQGDLSAGKNEARMDVASFEIEPELKATMREVDVTLDDLRQDEGPQADNVLDSEESAFIEGPELEMDNDYTSLETVADALKEIDLEPERATDISEEIDGPTIQEEEGVVEKAQEPANEALPEGSGSTEDFDQGVETPLEADTEAEGRAPQEVDEAEPALPEEIGSTGVETPLEADTEAEERATQEVELVDEAEPALVEALEVFKPKEDFDYGLKTPLEADTEPEGGTTNVYEPEAEAEAEAEVSEPEPDVEVLSESKPDQEGTYETKTDQQDLIKLEPDQLNGEKLEEGEVISPPGEVPNDEGADAADIEVVVGSEQTAVVTQADESKDYSQDRADVDVMCDQEEVEVHRSVESSEEDLNIEQPPAITVDEEVSVGEGPHAAETEQPQFTLDDKHDLTRDLRTFHGPSDASVLVEQGLSSTLPIDSETTINEDEPKDGDGGRDIGEEEAASSTVAEAGSVITDFDEHASYQQMSNDSEQDADISESRKSDETSSLRTPELQIVGEGREFVDTSLPRTPELIGMGSTEQVGGGEHADSWEDDRKVSGGFPKDEVEWKAVHDSEPTYEHEEVSPAPDNEITIVEAGGAGEENYEQGAVPPTFGIVPALEYLAVVEKELALKVLPSDTDGLRSLPTSEAPTYSPGEGKGIDDTVAVNTDEAEIRTAEAKDSAPIPSGEDRENTFSNGALLRSASPERDITDIQAFCQQNTQEASLPVVIPTQDVKQRASVQGNAKGNEHSSGGGTLQHRTNWLGCCGMLDLLVGKNK